MIVLDANVFLRVLTQPETQHDAPRAQAARALLTAIEDRVEHGLTSDAIVAEVAFILTSPRHYDLPRGSVADALARLVRLPNLDVPRKAAVLGALRLWADHDALDFPDALVVVYARLEGARLASFDRDVRRLAEVPLWEPT